MRDPERPRQRRPAPRVEAPHAEQRGREGLGRQVGGQLGVSGLTHQPAEQRLLVAAVEDRERLRPARRHRQQLVVREAFHVTSSRTPPQL
jgi:hypothetical protein